MAAVCKATDEGRAETVPAASADIAVAFFTCLCEAEQRNGKRQVYQRVDRARRLFALVPLMSRLQEGWPAELPDKDMLHSVLGNSQRFKYRLKGPKGEEEYEYRLRSMKRKANDSDREDRGKMIPASQLANLLMDNTAVAKEAAALMGVSPGNVKLLTELHKVKLDDLLKSLQSDVREQLMGVLDTHKGKLPLATKKAKPKNLGSLLREEQDWFENVLCINDESKLAETERLRDAIMEGLLRLIKGKSKGGSRRMVTSRFTYDFQRYDPVEKNRLELTKAAKRHVGVVVRYNSELQEFHVIHRRPLGDVVTGTGTEVLAWHHFVVAGGNKTAENVTARQWFETDLLITVSAREIKDLGSLKRQKCAHHSDAGRDAGPSTGDARLTAPTASARPKKRKKLDW